MPGSSVRVDVRLASMSIWRRCSTRIGTAGCPAAEKSWPSPMPPSDPRPGRAGPGAGQSGRLGGAGGGAGGGGHRRDLHQERPHRQRHRHSLRAENVAELQGDPGGIRDKRLPFVGEHLQALPRRTLDGPPPPAPSNGRDDAARGSAPSGPPDPARDSGRALPLRPLPQAPDCRSGASGRGEEELAAAPRLSLSPPGRGPG